LRRKVYIGRGQRYLVIDYVMVSEKIQERIIEFKIERLNLDHLYR